jgi:hypothetical protein
MYLLATKLDNKFKAEQFSDDINQLCESLEYRKLIRSDKAIAIISPG